MNTLKASQALLEWANNNRSVTLSGKLLEAVTLAREAQEAPPQAATKPAHTPTPVPPVHLRRLYDDNKPDGYMESDRDYIKNNEKAAVYFLDNATLIVRAVNSHAELVAALERTAERLEIVLRAQRFGQDKTFIEDSIATHPDLIVAKTALAIAKGQP